MKILGSSRPQWASNFVYILAAVGCAAGLGNLWRFSMLAYEHGGAAFIFALLLCNIFIVFPLLMMETIVGQKFQFAGPQAFEKIKRGTGWIQWIPAFLVAGILLYYMPILAWGIKYLVLSFSGEFLTDPGNFFTEKIIHLSSGIQEVGTFQWGLLAALVAGYLFVLYSLRKNVLSLGPVVKITATAPFVLLLILIIRGITLPGAGAGLEALFIPDWGSLGDVRLWQAAAGQSFFSASLAMGYFIIAGSHRGEKKEVMKTSLWILVGNFIVSIFCGLAVFSTLGFMALQQGVPISEAATGGPMLVFSVLPTAVSLMPWGAILFAVLLFLVVITLAIDSIFGVLEVVVGTLHDLWHKVRYLKVMAWACLILALGSLPYLTGAGLYYLDITDHYIGTYGLLIVGMLETALLAYWVGPEKIRKWLNHTEKGLKVPRIFNVLLYIIPLVLAFLLGGTLYAEWSQTYGGYPMEYIIKWGFVPLGVVIVLSIIFGRLTFQQIKKHGFHIPGLKK
ncbi:MAG: sodium-dependent transporter [Candidatus Gracilibacteria bacterium]|nr:sodium-dependent transporter [Candidatus Gracilibacteria bacterium]